MANQDDRPQGQQPPQPPQSQQPRGVETQTSKPYTDDEQKSQKIADLDKQIADLHAQREKLKAG